MWVGDFDFEAIVSVSELKEVKKGFQYVNIVRMSLIYSYFIFSGRSIALAVYVALNLTGPLKATDACYSITPNPDYRT